MTLDAYLDEWLALLRTRIQPTTFRGYDDMINAYLRPGLGQLRVGELTVHQLDLYFVHLLQQGGRRGGPLKRSTVKYAHTILRQALKEAVRDDLLDDNVAARVRLPRLDPERDPEPQDLRTWDAAQAARFLELTADDPLHQLRHCHACLLLDQGVPIKVVSERLGHASITMTMDAYAHVLPAQDQAAADAIQRALRGPGAEDTRDPTSEHPSTLRAALAARGTRS